VDFKEPSWNPALKAQAIEFLYRLGQSKKVNLYQKYVWGTMKMEYILQTQGRKGELAIYVVLRSSNILKYGINGGNEDTDAKETGCPTQWKQRVHNFSVMDRQHDQTKKVFCSTQCYSW
jgi:hypothetical protein